MCRNNIGTLSFNAPTALAPSSTKNNVLVPSLFCQRERKQSLILTEYRVDEVGNKP